MAKITAGNSAEPPARNRVSRVSVVDQVCESIKKSIVSGKLKSGDKLPSENDLAAEYEVNRLSVRMALQKLSTLGLIETRVGEGSFVCSFTLRPLIGEIVDLYSKKENFRQVWLLRRSLECISLYIAVISAHNDEKENLGRILSEYNRCVDAYRNDTSNEELLQELSETDYIYHGTVVKMSHNPIFSDIFCMIKDLTQGFVKDRYRECFNEPDAITPYLREYIEKHYTIYKCILNSDLGLLHRYIDSLIEYELNNYINFYE